MKNNLNLDYLKPPSNVFLIKHADHYIKHGEGTDHNRKIFSNVVFDDFEQNFLLEFKEYLKKNNVNFSPQIEDKKLMMYCYNGHFNLETSLDNLKLHLEWINNQIFHTLTDDVLEILQKGIFYNYGVDKLFRPLIFISFPSDLKKYKVDDLLTSICVLLNTIQKYMFVPGYVENWVVLMEASNIGFGTLSNYDIIKKIIKIMSINFTCTLEKQFIMNPPFFIKKAWNVIEKFINPGTRAKINFLAKKDFHKIFDFIDPNQLENKYGGNLPNLTEFWPPKLTPLQKQFLNNEQLIKSTQQNTKKHSLVCEKIVYELNKEKPHEFKNEESEILYENQEILGKNQLDDNDIFFDFDEENTFFYYPPCLLLKFKD